MNRVLYNTNGFAFHRLDDAARIVAGLGYDGLAWTPDLRETFCDSPTTRRSSIEGSSSRLSSI